jgi:hypothetical protein
MGVRPTGGLRAGFGFDDVEASRREDDVIEVKAVGGDVVEDADAGDAQGVEVLSDGALAIATELELGYTAAEAAEAPGGQQNGEEREDGIDAGLARDGAPVGDPFVDGQQNDDKCDDCIGQDEVEENIVESVLEGLAGESTWRMFQRVTRFRGHIWGPRNRTR